MHLCKSHGKHYGLTLKDNISKNVTILFVCKYLIVLRCGWVNMCAKCQIYDQVNMRLQSKLKISSLKRTIYVTHTSATIGYLVLIDHVNENAHRGFVY